MSITITYVTITYNAAKVLQRTLDSVLSQDYPDIVHLIIDGASTDGTLEIINDYIERSNDDKRFTSKFFVFFFEDDIFCINIV